MSVIPESISTLAAFDFQFRARWTISSSAFSRDAFLHTLDSLVLFPERTSTSILRADIVEEPKELLDDAVTNLISLSDWNLQRCIARRLLPRNPRIDQAMLQDCYFFSSIAYRPPEALVIFEPRDKEHIPYYHPQLSAVAFHYTPQSTTISYLPLTGDLDIGNESLVIEPTQQANRLNRTLLHLLKVIAKHSVGYMNHYQKRVQHDLVVPKVQWQDSYVRLKTRFASEYMDKWVEDTDPKKHVFEDLGIASFLINLWTLSEMSGALSHGTTTFVDVGCGNGLLVDILRREGWTGYGFDARQRKSWSIYGQETYRALKEMILYPVMLNNNVASTSGVTGINSTEIDLHLGRFEASQFLIGNHADELTPYIPLLAALASRTASAIGDDNVINVAGFMIIPCCTHTFSGEKHNALSVAGGRYASYISWLIEISEAVGWVVEREALRIPSTRNWALIGRKRRLIECETPQNDFRDPEERLLDICRQIINKNGGMRDFLSHARSLNVRKPRSH